jgi:cation transport ATPase
VVLFFKHDFVVAIVDYFPVVLFLGWAFLAAYHRTRRTAFRLGFLGICVMLVAAAVQQARIGIHPRYFNHNAVYHVLQAIGQFMVFIAARDACRQSEVRQP